MGHHSVDFELICVFVLDVLIAHLPMLLSHSRLLLVIQAFSPNVTVKNG